jgi:hypothetical protein
MTDLPRLDQLVAHVASADPDAGPLDRLAAAVAAAERLDELGDHLIGHFVDAARRGGASWTEIGQRLGVSKQAVQKRFVANAFGDLDAPGGERFARFTARAKAVVMDAQQRARAAGHVSVVPLHVLLGLLHERDALAAKAMAARGLPLDAIAARVDSALGPSRGEGTQHVRFATSSKQLLERTLREALLLGHNYIGTEHMLLAMLGDPDEAAGRLLVDAGLDRAWALDWLLTQLAR